MKPSHPGQTLLNFLEPCGISQNALARRMGVPPRRINEIVLGKRSITADTAIGLAEVLGTTELFWMRLQADYDLAIARSRRPPRPPMPDWDSFPDYYDEWDALSDRAREHNMEAQRLDMEAQRLAMTRDVMGQHVHPTEKMTGHDAARYMTPAVTAPLNSEAEKVSAI